MLKIVVAVGGRTPLIRASVVALVTVMILVGSINGSAGAQSTPVIGEDVPANLTPPEESVFLFELGARGFQIYVCEIDPDDATAYVWTFQAPEAELLNERGEPVGSHFGGPTWQGLDGSAVVAEVIERADAPEAGAIPWLLLGATEHAGTGVFATITHIQRLETVGGTAPAEGCDADHAGEEVRVPYETTYAFYYSYPATTDLPTATPMPTATPRA